LNSTSCTVQRTTMLYCAENYTARCNCIFTYLVDGTFKSSLSKAQVPGKVNVKKPYLLDTNQCCRSGSFSTGSGILDPAI